jgi:hypothetical protein
MPEVLTAPGANQERDHESPNTFDVFVSYNGVEKSFTVNINEPVHVLLGKAIKEFGVTNQPHILSLFNQSNVELPDAAKLGEVGVKEGDHLLMRPSAVKGG